MSELAIVSPVDVTDARLIAYSVTETETAWNSGTAYAIDVLVRYQHKVWKSINGTGNTNKTPGTAAGAAYWEYAYPTNAWAAFDSSNSTKTTATGTISLQLRPGRVVNAVALLGVSGVTSARVRVIDPVDGTVYDRTTSMVQPLSAASWYEWYFSPVSYRTQLVLLDLPAYGTADVYVDLTGPAELSVGVMLFGFMTTLPGTIAQGARFGTASQTRRVLDAYDNIVFDIKPSARRATVRADIPNGQIEQIDALLTSLDGITTLWVLLREWAPLQILGIAQEFEWVTDALGDRTWLHLNITGNT